MIFTSGFQLTHGIGISAPTAQQFGGFVVTDLETLDSLYAKSTPGTWEAVLDHDDHHDGKPQPSWYVSWGDPNHDSTLMVEADAQFAAALHNSYPALRDRLRALENWAQDAAMALTQWHMVGTNENGAADSFAFKVGIGSITTHLLKRLAALDKEANS